MTYIIKEVPKPMSSSSSSSSAPKNAFALVVNNVLADYKKNSTKKLLMVDAFIVYSLVTAMIQVRPKWIIFLD